MPNPSCFASLDLCAIRTAKLDTGGGPLGSADNANGYVSEAMIKLDVGVEIETGEEFVRKNGCGSIAATFKEDDQVKRVTLAMDLSLLDLYLLEATAGFRLFMHTAQDAAVDTPRGFQFRAITGAAPASLCLEAWTKAIDGDTVATPLVLLGQGAWMRWVFPSTRWVMGQFTLEHDFSVFPVTGTGTENSNITANGPFNDWPTEVQDGGGITAIGGMFYDDTIPTATCATTTVPVQA